jgi:hypothetical protein
MSIYLNSSHLETLIKANSSPESRQRGREYCEQREFDEIKPIKIHAQWDLQSSYPRKSCVN